MSAVLPDSKPRRRLLPYLVNRREQELKLAKAIQAHHNKFQPLLCFIHGNDNECLDSFIERLQETILPQFDPEIKHHGIKASYFNCGDIVRQVDELYDNMLSSLGEKLLNNLCAPPEEIAHAIVREQRLVLLHTSWCSKDWKQAGGIELIKKFIQFWANWPHLPAQNPLVIICLAFHYKEIEKRSLWQDWFKMPTLNQEIRQMFNEQLEVILKQYQLHGVILPELNSLEIESVEHWAREYLQECCDEVIPKIRKLFSSPEHQIPMEQLVEHLKQIQNECY